MGRDQGRVVAEPLAVDLRDVWRSFGDTTAVAGVTLQIGRGEFVSLLGPSGCGKTTLLRIIAGLEAQDAGEVWLDGRDYSTVPPHGRPTNLVFQRYALFPHLSVADNIGFALSLKRTSKPVIAAEVDAMLELVRLEGFGKRRVDELSGGQAQRVALARALIDHPPVLLLDEPLAALDLKLRQQMQLELRHIQRRVGTTFIFVTHDQEEALVMSDRIILMNEGTVIQEGTPRDVYHEPSSIFVSSFLGEANLFRGQVTPGPDGKSHTVTTQHVLFVRNGRLDSMSSDVYVSLRPERIRVRPATVADAGAAPAANTAIGSVSEVIFLGAVVRYVVEVNGAMMEVEVANLSDEGFLVEGQRVVLEWGATDVVLIANETG